MRKWLLWVAVLLEASMGDWLLRSRKPAGRRSPIGRLATYRSASGLEATVRVLCLDDTETQAHVRHAFGTAWVQVSELQFHDA